MFFYLKQPFFSILNKSKAEQNATELTELKNKLYFAYLFINILWMVISLAVKQANKKIALPQENTNQLPFHAVLLIKVRSAK